MENKLTLKNNFNIQNNSQNNFQDNIQFVEAEYKMVNNNRVKAKRINLDNMQCDKDDNIINKYNNCYDKMMHCNSLGYGTCNVPFDGTEDDAEQICEIFKNQDVYAKLIDKAVDNDGDPGMLRENYIRISWGGANYSERKKEGDFDQELYNLKCIGIGALIFVILLSIPLFFK